VEKENVKTNHTSRCGPSFPSLPFLYQEVEQGEHSLDILPEESAEKAALSRVGHVPERMWTAASVSMSKALDRNRSKRTDLACPVLETWKCTRANQPIFFGDLSSCIEILHNATNPSRNL
jgi:hypothetical protein